MAYYGTWPDLYEIPLRAVVRRYTNFAKIHNSRRQFEAALNNKKLS